ncbi:MAG: hypothetical protein HY520_02940 [Candidatus Aenigmarchaeota archaeon]|nr:hypothetical protein [Candidatus Aenigmarchaeota archaeon]
MVEVVDLLVEILCQQGTTGECSQFLSSYPDLTQQLLWLVFFPSVFLLLLVFFISDGVAKDGAKKYKVLVAVALYLFIIFQGWYHFALVMSRFWFVGIIIIGGILVLTKKMGAASGEGREGAPREARKLASTITSDLSQRGLRIIRGDEQNRVNEIKGLLNEMRRLLHEMDSGKAPGDALRMLNGTAARAREALDAYRKEASMVGFPIGGTYHKLNNDLINLNEKILRQEKKT